MELYYAIMNIVDYLALDRDGIDTNKRCVLISILKDLCSIGGYEIEDIADANDCGECHTLGHLIKEIRKQFNSGERVPIRKEN